MDENTGVHESLAIVPVGDLKTTADAIGKVLGLEFHQDLDWTYDEFPTYTARFGTTQFDLLGKPDPEYDVREHKCEEFQFIVQDDTVSNTRAFVEDLLGRLAGAGIKCWWLQMVNSNEVAED